MWQDFDQSEKTSAPSLKREVPRSGKLSISKPSGIQALRFRRCAPRSWQPAARSRSSDGANGPHPGRHASAATKLSARDPVLPRQALRKKPPEIRRGLELRNGRDREADRSDRQRWPPRASIGVWLRFDRTFGPSLVGEKRGKPPINWHSR